MKLWKRPIAHLFRDRDSHPEHRVSVRFRGLPAGNPSEELITRVAGGRELVSLSWLKEHVAYALYYAELREGGWLVDVGTWGLAIFRKEAETIIADMRPEFGLLVEESEAGRKPREVAGMDPFATVLNRIEPVRKNAGSDA